MTHRKTYKNIHKTHTNAPGLVRHAIPQHLRLAVVVAAVVVVAAAVGRMKNAATAKAGRLQTNQVLAALVILINNTRKNTQ